VVPGEWRRGLRSHVVALQLVVGRRLHGAFGARGNRHSGAKQEAGPLGGVQHPRLPRAFMWAVRSNNNFDRRGSAHNLNPSSGLGG